MNSLRHIIFVFPQSYYFTSLPCRCLLALYACTKAGVTEVAQVEPVWSKITRSTNRAN